jgi:hypothetical protein
MRRREWRDAPKGSIGQGPFRAIPVRERVVIHTYQNARGESIEIILNEFAWFVVYCDGHVIHSEARARHQGPHTEETAKTRALAYEQQDHAEYTRLIAQNGAQQSQP